MGESLSTVVSRHLTEGLAEDQGRRRELLLEAGMAHELDDGLRELAAVGQRLLKVRGATHAESPGTTGTRRMVRPSRRCRWRSVAKGTCLRETTRL